jgi:anthranilate synthase component 1
MAEEYFPDMKSFLQKAGEANLIPVWREFPADLDTPVSVFLKLGGGSPAFLLESVEGGERLGRYSFLGAGYSAVLVASENKTTVVTPKETISYENVAPLQIAQEMFSRWRVAKIAGSPPFCGGAVGYLGYEMSGYFERLPQPPNDELGLPDCVLLFTDTLLIFDHVQHKLKILANAYIENDPEEAYSQAKDRIAALAARLTQFPNPQGEDTPLADKLTMPPLTSAVSQQEYSEVTSGGFTSMRSNFTPEEFAQMVINGKEYIVCGDVIQVVPSQRLRRKTNAKPFNIYRALRMLNPSPYMFYLDLGQFQLIGSSPEMLVKLEGNRAESRPIAGTRPRGSTEAEDDWLIAELQADPKERAEHIMLVDLARNDLGRVCQYGTVRVPQLLAVEKYSHVSHLVSAVEGRLREDADAFKLLRATFPAGTVSGAPKIRAMEIISELEKLKRGPYAGAVGYFSFDGNMDTCITIRTIVMSGDTAYLQGGAGIVADSDPQREYQESLSKIKVLDEAVSLAESQFLAGD